ncbi:uncharacterized protein A1O5_03315 [Cladophialophora psammophila CBS 110553]|uniref:Dynamin GTPase n=1 Tax=Cladophialophora psammophila CBS 110553 TaxID=1182543 RepID=W9XTE0_9EURO|nr:uncharacterized protein A1O5_03315 [Cladophialophora psammophila CBS 110553]EXJ73554.1 hypothetical protein A1O5_03315 [Cladophialophora psammophila CBS 110553]
MTMKADVSTEAEGPLGGLQSARSTLRLEQIANLRALGIGNHIGLPQLLVCGDQSAGKSSVLEGVTGIPFPRQDGLCTKFATEILLQHSAVEQFIDASIIPSPIRPDEDKERFTTFHRRLHGFEDLPMVIEEVGRLMGIRGVGGNEVGPAFGLNVLRIEFHGPVGLHLSIVDVPGLIAVPNEEQTDDDVETVHRLVDSYISNPRTIILAVVQAGNDIANQSIIKKSRQFDPDGERTVGIITKPDLINQGSEKRIALLASNKDTTKLKLGFFLVKNPAPNKLTKGITPEQRQKDEIQYFHTSPWKEQLLDPDRLGVLALRKFLQKLLNTHIEKEMPNVRKDVRELLQKTESDLANMGEERDSPSKMRMFLTRLAMAFHQRVTSGLNGTYDDIDMAFFASHHQHPSHRLRATVQNLNTKFAETMRERGGKRRVVSDDQSDIDLDEHDNVQIVLSKNQMKMWIREVYQSSRGKELPGTYNYVLLAELFHEQSSRWLSIAEEHMHTTGSIVRDFVEAVIRHTSPDQSVSDEIIELVRISLHENMRHAAEELQKLWDQEWHGKLHISNIQGDIERFLTGLQQRVQVNMTEQAYDEALSGLQAYYKVAMKTFVDNVCRQVVERHITRPLPLIYSAEKVARLSDEELCRIAGETLETSAKRKQLQELRRNLEMSLQELSRSTVA